MKATTAVCDTVGSVNGVSAGRVHKPRRDVENEEVQMYLSKLKELVPFMPKNKRLSKLEVIQHVIDYICDLQYALEAHPNAEALITTALPTVQAVPAPNRAHHAQPRQPLGVLGVPNTIVAPGNTCAVQEQVSITTPSHLREKVPSADSRQVSC
ncbi:extra macrochaetae [Frankliniella occidentalis]|uniref:Protein extra-macrochaetae n=1 Tax=Frankliniella occidentalis TaxID=133901 RepID=A0A6J1T0J8_FRAOC|nr:protein extra-macrochaetae [Frankliniella occidentalis]KAE8744497.1 extra macrochaetae [Frankliniella occidentalis]